MGIVYLMMTLTLMNQTLSRAVLMNEQRLSNGPSTQLVQWSVTTQHSWAVALTPSLQGQGRMSFFLWVRSHC